MALGGHQRNPVAGARGRPLHVCPECASELVYPTDWLNAGDDRWTVSLRCPNCEWQASGTFDQPLIDALDEVLEDGVQALLSSLREIAHDNMSEEIDRFVAALRADALLPMDF